MHQLSGLDASFLNPETGEMPMHVGAMDGRAAVSLANALLDETPLHGRSTHVDPLPDPDRSARHGMALNITVQSYDQSLDFAPIGGSAALPPALPKDCATCRPVRRTP